MDGINVKLIHIKKINDVFNVFGSMACDQFSGERGLDTWRPSRC